jgi:hypothetical protein
MPTNSEHRFVVSKLNDKVRMVIAFLLVSMVSLSVYVGVVHALNALSSDGLL